MQILEEDEERGGRQLSTGGRRQEVGGEVGERVSEREKRERRGT